MSTINKYRRWLAGATLITTLAGGISAQSSDDSKKSNNTQRDSKKSNNNESKSDNGKPSDRSSRAAWESANRPIDPRAFDHELLSRLIFDLTNAERSKAGMAEFDNNRYLDSAALTHSRDMASRGYFNHKSKGIFNRTDHSDRIRATGYNPRTSAENIAMIPTFNSQRIQSYPGGGSQVVSTDYNSYQRMAHYAVQQWMNSPGHRANILNRQLTELGVGVAIGMEGNIPYVYLTQNFGG